MKRSRLLAAALACATASGCAGARPREKKTIAGAPILLKTELTIERPPLLIRKYGVAGYHDFATVVVAGEDAKARIAALFSVLHPYADVQVMTVEEYVATDLARVAPEIRDPQISRLKYDLQTHAAVIFAHEERETGFFGFFRRWRHRRPAQKPYGV